MNHRHYQFLSSGICIVLTVCTATMVVGATHVTLRDRAVAASSVVRLGDVAEIASADRTQGRQLAAIPLMPAPPAGTERFLSKREVADLLAAHGYDLREFQMEGAAQVAISTSSPNPGNDDAVSIEQPMNRHAAILAGHVDGTPEAASDELTAATHREELNRAIASHLESQSGRMGSWQVTCNLAERHIALLHAATSPLACQGGREPWLGRQRFVISFSIPQSDVQIPVYAEVGNESAQVAVAIRPIARGEVITAADVEMQSPELAPAIGRRSAIDSVEQLVGMEAKQAIQMGDVILTDHVQAPILIKRGEEISIVSQSGGIRVRTTARARQDGARGQLVQVESIESKERYDVRVVGLREAAIFSATSLPSVETPAKQVETARR
jgi:flagella basal body P-ring formation protein FlgA